MSLHITFLAIEVEQEHISSFGSQREMAQKEGSNCTVSPPTGRKRGPELGRFRVKVTFHGDRGRA